MVAAFSNIIRLADVASESVTRLNIFVLEVLKDPAFGNLFWTMVLTGSIGMAIWVVCISYASHIARALFSHSP